MLDVDGVLNPFRRPGPEWGPYTCTAAGQPYLLWLNPAHGPLLLALAHATGAELVWATTWQHDANTSIGPILGLPELPVIEVDKGRGAEGPGCCWKIPAVAEFVDRRPFVWFDDDLGRADRLWLEAHPNVGRFRLLYVGSSRGIRDAHLRQARAWLTSG
ncbi:HAD domain-containing protein [Herbidospora sp. NBRC 101105]|uniref:HAD domain-containing protein n=1 Tax=Herbidospora sp. NBRC 101105 TaxID=3032195 RepID=UPI002553E5DA|nr:HAD domain-containing protein [Herbidospora sp. NBRC 101105]